MNSSRKQTIFFSAWLAISLLQAFFTNLTSDEGYYWFYSSRLQWGYYDHPPLTALMIKAGYSLLHNELGVRLFNVLITSFSLLLFFRMIPENLKQKNFTYLVLLVQPLLHYFSIIVFPDGPLLFFSLLFLLGYKRLIEKNDLPSALMMGLAMSGMFYSKYYGVLVILFTVLSNFKLFRSKWFWFSLVIPAMLSLPHFVWQYKNDFPSLKYHLLERVSGFRWSYALEYISQQIPAIGPVFLIAAFGFRSGNQFEKTLKYISIGTLLFFLLASFRSFVHFHWTSPILFPLMYIAIKYYQDKKKKVIFYWLGLPFLVIIILFRIHIVVPFLPGKQNDLGYYKNRDQWAEDIAQLAAGRPVLFAEDFRAAGLYTFYSGNMSLALFSNAVRKSQYDLWGYEDSIQSKKVLVVRKRSFPGCDEFPSQMGTTIYYRRFSNFESYYNIPVKIRSAMNGNDTLHVSIEIINNRKTNLNFYNDSLWQRPTLFYEIRTKNKELLSDTLKVFSENDKLLPGNTLTLEYDLSVKNLNDGTYYLSAGFYNGIIPPSYNLMNNKFKIKRHD